jgi:hypothetical protein
MSKTPSQICCSITSLFCELETHLDITSTDKVGIPDGVVRKISKIMPKLYFVANETIRRNICYAVEALDFYRWIIKRFHVYGPVRGYLYKTSIILADMIVEAMVRDFLGHNGITCGKHSKNISKLSRFGFSTKLVEQIKALHSRRSNIHLHLVSDLEATKYDVKGWNRSMTCMLDTKNKIEKLLFPS